MRTIHRVLAAAAGAAGLAVAYTVGAATHGSQPPAPVTATPEPAAEPLVRMPDHVPAPTAGPPVAVDNPTAVLFGQAKVPDDLLRPPAPPARPDLVVPTLPK